VKHNLVKAFENTPLGIFCDLFREGMASDHETAHVSAGRLMAAVRKATGSFPFGTQCDAHEFFVTLLAEFDETIQKIQQTSHDDNFTMFSPAFMTEATTAILCSCQKVKQIQEKHACIPIRFIYHAFHDSIDHFAITDQEVYRELACHAAQGFTVDRQITRLPDVLVFQFCRFFLDDWGRLKKELRHIPWPATLTLRDCTGEKRYCMTSAVVHIGPSLKSGHYISVLKVGTSWIYADDGQLRSLKDAEVEGFTKEGTVRGWGQRCTSAYLLFYERAEHLRLLKS
jgi:uncharacterized UBP type Zn finger protein